MEESKHPDPIIVTGPTKLQEAPDEASFDFKDTRPKPIKPTNNTTYNPHNQPLKKPEMYLNSILTHRVNQILPTSIYLNRKTPEPIPNKKPTPTRMKARRDHVHSLPELLDCDNGKVHTSRFWPQCTKPSIISPDLFTDRTRLKLNLKETLTSAQVQNRVLDVAQLLAMEIAIIRHLPKFDPGGNGSFEEEGFAWLRFGGVVTHIGRILNKIQRRTKVSGRRFGERRRIGIFRMGIEEEDAGLKEVEEARVLNDLIWGLIEEEIRDLRRGTGDFNPRDFGSSMKRELGISEGDIWGFLVKLRSKEDKGRKVFNGVTPNPISKRCRFDASRIGLDGSAFGKPVQTHKWADWAVLQLSIHSALGYLGQQHIWATIAICLSLQFSSLDNWASIPNFHP